MITKSPLCEKVPALTWTHYEDCLNRINRNGPPHMAKQKQDDQPELTYSSYVRTQDVTQKTYRRRWMIGRSGERWSRISVLAERHDDDDNGIASKQVLLLCYVRLRCQFWKILPLQEKSVPLILLTSGIVGLWGKRISKLRIRIENVNILRSWCIYVKRMMSQLQDMYMCWFVDLIKIIAGRAER